jgi:hypothetical protein
MCITVPTVDLHHVDAGRGQTGGESTAVTPHARLDHGAVAAR